MNAGNLAAKSGSVSDVRTKVRSFSPIKSRAFSTPKLSRMPRAASHCGIQILWKSLLDASSVRAPTTTRRAARPPHRNPRRRRARPDARPLPRPGRPARATAHRCPRPGRVRVRAQTGARSPRPRPGYPRVRAGHGGCGTRSRRRRSRDSYRRSPRSCVSSNSSVAASPPSSAPAGPGSAIGEGAHSSSTPSRA